MDEITILCNNLDKFGDALADVGVGLLSILAITIILLYLSLLKRLKKK